MSDTRFTEGQRVVALDAFGDLKNGVVRRPPPDWRQGDSLVSTRGKFPKVWVQFVRHGTRGPAVPWPVEDVFTDAAKAEAAQQARRRVSESKPVVAAPFMVGGATNVQTNRARVGEDS